MDVVDSKTGNRVRIVAISDTHQYHARLVIPACDILVYYYQPWYKAMMQ